MSKQRNDVSTQDDQERDYVLGTHDEEVERLALQHRVWRPRALDAWRRAGFTVGQTIIDVGCGPGHATHDLADIVGQAGRVLAIDRSKKFLSTLEATARRRGLNNIERLELDLDSSGGTKTGDVRLPFDIADGAWARWVFAFLKKPRGALECVAKALKSGGVLVLHEYFDYSTWRMAPRVPELEEFVGAVMQSWRAEGGEPDVALELPRWLRETGFELRSLQPIVDFVPASNFVWQWPRSFVAVGLRRLVDLGHVKPDRAEAILRAFSKAESTPHTFMVTPAVLEIIAVRD